ncbi:hypothetical protein ACFSM5_13615 [Lacibacterium aquatile]|uniref:Uncharacterized protein n=1 Tax=Lacibacterium aquatile TaxID=1168082 RepID=A0ABW5DU09_9PROT
MRLFALLGAAAAFSLSACVAGPPPEAAVLNLDFSKCVAKPDIASARPLAAEQELVPVAVDKNSACLETPAGRATYVAFKLPASPALLDIFSLPNGTGNFLSPRAMLLDADGVQLREIARDNFLFRANRLHAAVRQRPGEAYLVVTSDPASIGQTSDRVSSHAVYTHTGYAMVTSGYDVKNLVLFAHNGSVGVATRPLPKP